VKEIAAARTSEERFDVAVIGHSAPGETGLPERYAAAGATWWLESIHDRRGPPERLLRRIEAGPPRP